MRARIDSSITLDSTLLSEALRERILAELSMKNPDRDRAISEQIRGANFLPETLNLWGARGKTLVIPRGFAHKLEQIFNQHDEQIEWESSMSLRPFSERCFADWPEVELRDYQFPARDAMLDWAQGIFRAPTGAGKTVTTLEAARWAGQKTLIIVGKTSLARQWQNEVLERYGYEAGYIGEGEWKPKDFTVAIWQTLWAKQKEVDPGFWKEWGMVVGDEIHHASAVSLSEMFGLFPAFYRLGVSATPRWDALLYPIVEAVVGPVIFRTTEEDVAGRLMVPSVKFIPTDFAAEYRPTEVVGRKRVQNNFAEIMAALVKDAHRNELIARIARDEAQAGHHVLIVTRRIEHVKRLVELLEKTLQVGSRLNALTGSQSGHDAQRISRLIESSEKGTVLISTVADEALDMPKLDRLILGFPLRKTPLIEQQAGRIRRMAEGKQDAIIYDLADDEVGPLAAQKRERSQLYARRRWPVERLIEAEAA